MKPSRISLKAVENGYIVDADFPTGEKNQYGNEITVSKEYVCYDGNDLDTLIVDLRNGAIS